MKRLITLLVLAALCLTPLASLADTEMDIFELCEYFRAAFGLPEDDDYRHNVAYIDPAACFGFINHDCSVKDDMIYIMQATRTEEELQLYMDHLQMLGYHEYGVMTHGDFTGVHLENYDIPLLGTRSIPDTLDVYYNADLGMLVVVYNEDYDTVQRIWRARSLRGNVQALPASAADKDGDVLIVEEALLVKSASITAPSLEELLPYYPASHLEDQGVFIQQLENDSWQVDIDPQPRGLNRAEDLLLVHVSISNELNYATSYPSYQRYCLIERDAEEFCEIMMPVFIGKVPTFNNGRAYLQPVREQLPTDFWLVFKPFWMASDVPLRLYFCMEAGDYGAYPMEEWPYIDFYVSAEQ